MVQALKTDTIRYNNENIKLDSIKEEKKMKTWLAGETGQLV